MKTEKDAFLLKADFVPLTVIKMSNNDIGEFKEKWKNTLAKAPQYFVNAPIVIDVKGITNADNLDIQALCETLKTTNIIPVGIKGLSQKHHEVAVKNGLEIGRAHV